MWLFLIYATFGVSLKMTAIRLYTADLKWLALLTYISYYFLLHEFTQIRAGVAIGLVLLSIKPVLDRDPLRFAALVTIASLFHYSALIAVPIYFAPIVSLSLNRKIALALAVPVGMLLNYLHFEILYILPIEVVRQKTLFYIESESLRDIKINVYNYVYIVKYLMLYVFLFYSEKIESRSRYFPIILQMYAISLFSYLAFAFNSAFSIRISELFGVVEMLLIPMLYHIFPNKFLAVGAICLLAFGNIALGLFQTVLIQPV